MTLKRDCFSLIWTLIECHWGKPQGQRRIKLLRTFVRVGYRGWLIGQLNLQVSTGTVFTNRKGQSTTNWTLLSSCGCTRNKPNIWPNSYQCTLLSFHAATALFFSDKNKNEPNKLRRFCLHLKQKKKEFIQLGFVVSEKYHFGSKLYFM